MRGNGSRKLKDEHKAFIVQRLAVFDTPKQAAEALKAEFGVRISPQGAEAYDPTKRAGCRLSGGWRTLFVTTRQRYLRRLDDVPEAHKAVRVKQLACAARAYRDRGAYLQMARILEQIAKEMGGMYTNRRELMGREGGPIQLQEMGDEEVNRELARHLAETGLLG